MLYNQVNIANEVLMKKPDSEQMFAHIVFFSLPDRSPSVCQRFIDACKKFLDGHPGLIHFSLAKRDVEMTRPVVDQNFDFAMHMIFESKGAYEAYARHKRHEEFITVAGSISNHRRVFDSLLIAQDAAAQAASEPAN